MKTETKENTNKDGLGIYYDHTKIEDKAFFGGYFNLADNNIDNTFNIFAGRFGLEYNKKDKDKEAKNKKSDFINKIYIK